MGGQPLRRRLQGLYRELNLPVRRLLRRFKIQGSLLGHAVRHRLDGASGPRVDSTLDSSAGLAVSDPAIVLVAPLPESTAGQTESSVTTGADETAPFIAHGDGLAKLPAAHLEAMVMAAAAEDLDWVAAGWAEPAPGPFGPSGLIGRDPGVHLAAHVLFRRPEQREDDRRPVVGRVLPHITSAGACAGHVAVDGHPAAGPYRLRPDAARRAVIRHRCRPVDRVLAELPTVGGPPTVLFLLPFLAVGGAERLLFDLVAGLGERCRVLIATTDPHLASLGQTVDRARRLTPHVYTLGDWLPRPAVASAVRHLLRRWRVSTLVSWNGTVLFYDEVADLHRRFPALRIVNQHFNHTGGWIEHLSPSVNRAVDTQIAVNGPTAAALRDDFGVPPERIATIHHAVGAPAPVDPERRAELRRAMGIDDDTAVVGSFIRMHPQKRPLDIVSVARRMTGDAVHFLLVGGGPLDDAVDAELARAPLPNLTRWPMQEDASSLYDAIDICFMASEFEGLPVFLLDGLARGLPCVATAVGDIPMMLSEGGGLTVAHPGDLDGLANALRTLLDDTRRRAEGERGRRTVENRFGLDRYVQAYESVIFPSS